jgi:hypothetical protein
MAEPELTRPFNETAAQEPPSKHAVAAFFTACEGGDTAGIRAFAEEHPGYINIRRKDRTGLMAAADSRFESTVTLLLELGADVNIVEDNGMTALIYASARGNKKVCQALIDAKADVRARTDDNKTVLHFATANNHVGLLELLLDNGAACLLGKADATGATPLWKALYYGYDKAADLLVERGAPFGASVDGEALIDMAIRKRGRGVIDKLEQKYAERFANLETGLTGGLSRHLQVKGPLKFSKSRPSAAPEPETRLDAWRAATRNGCRNFKF